MSNINIETKNGVVIAKELMITDYNDLEIGTKKVLILTRTTLTLIS